MPSTIKNDLPEVRAKFLLARSKILSELGCKTITPFARPDRESIYFTWFSKFPKWKNPRDFFRQGLLGLQKVHNLHIPVLDPPTV